MNPIDTTKAVDSNAAKYGSNFVAPTASSPYGSYQPNPTSTTVNNTPVNTTPSASAVQSTTPLVLPPQTTSTASNAAAGIMGSTMGMDGSLREIIDTEKQRVLEEQKAVNASKGQISDLTARLGGKGEAQIQAEQEANVPGLKQMYSDLTTEYQTRQLAYNSQYQSILNKPGLTREQSAQQIDELTRQHSFTLTDLGIRQAIAGNQYNTAQQLVDHKIDLQFGDLKDQIADQMKLLEQNQNNLTTAEKNVLQLQIENNTRQYEAETTKAKELETTKLDVLQQAIKNGADSATQKAIQNSQTTEEAYMSGSKYLADANTDVVKLDNGNTVLIDKRTGSIVKNLGGAKSTGGGAGTGTLSAAAQAVASNPNLINNYTPTLRGQITTELAQAGYDVTTLGAKPLSDSAIALISQDKNAIDSLNELKTEIQGNEQYLGPIQGFQALNPWSPAKILQAKVNLVRQKVGKALEGGVLRKEDEEKYKQILATLNDTPTLSYAKIDNLISTIQNGLDNYTAAQTGAGRSSNVTGALQKKGATTSGSTKTGNTYTITKE